MTTINKKFPRGVEVVGSAIIEDGEGKILLVKSPKWNYRWTMPGGHIEPGEGIEEALLREAEEEVGLRLKSSGIISFGELIGPKSFHRPAHFIYFDILCKTKNKRVKLDNEELKEYIWVDPRKALRMELAESYDKTIKTYLKFKEHT
ncbi:NUDIX domain-containing protein [Candidatus Uhrbacteria bacterium]|nr:NUDIX domain-containing protein [Candidatus Uhrbacteria bacterium]